VNQDWSFLETLLASASKGPWVLSKEGDDVAVVDALGQDITGLAPASEAGEDYRFIVETRNNLSQVLFTLDRYLQLLFQHRICIDCGIKMNRQLYCVKCDHQWEVDDPN